MSLNISKFVIYNLFGENTYEIRIEDNKLILVSENGSGKTTIVNIMYYFLSQQWDKLLQYNFSSITVTINNEQIKIDRPNLEQINNEVVFSNYLVKYPPRVRERFTNLFNNYDISDLKRMSYNDIEHISDRFNVTPRSINDFLNVIYNKMPNIDIFEKQIKEEEKKLVEILNQIQILYLPTFRRIEQEFKNIFPNFDSDYSKYNKRHYIQENEDLGYVELVEFGMEDVEIKINNTLHNIQNDFNNKLKNNLTGTYLRDILNEEYKKNETFEFTEESLNNVFKRIDDNFLSDREKQLLKNIVADYNISVADDAKKIKVHFIYRLLEIYNELRKEEEDINKFIDICNKYSANKSFIYDNINFAIKIESQKTGKEVKLKDLSSGEKQIVSLFSHLFLSKKKNFFIIIDEPELSLSVNWQNKFLPDILNTNYCSGLIAVTHSPFIFENELDKYAHGLDEFAI